MRLSSSRCLMAVAVLAALFAFPTRSYADGTSSTGCSNCNGYSYQATLTQLNNKGSYQLTFTITNVGGAAANPYNWSLTLSNALNTITAFSGLFGGSTPTLSTKGQSATFTFNFTCPNCGSLVSWDFLSSGLCAGSSNTNCYTINAYGGGSTSMAEPSTWALYGSTLLVLAIVFVWRNRTGAERRGTRLVGH